jgi:integrase
VATIFKAAVGDRLIAVSPCDRIALPKRPRLEIVPLEVDAVERLVVAMPERYRALVVFAAGTGLRQGECFGLTLDRVAHSRPRCAMTANVVTRPATRTPATVHATTMSGLDRAPEAR